MIGEKWRDVKRPDAAGSGDRPAGAWSPGRKPRNYLTLAKKHYFLVNRLKTLDMDWNILYN